MKKISRNIKSLFIITIILSTDTVFAQDPGGLDGDPGQQAPIDSWIPIMFILGLAFVFFFVYKKKATKN